WQQAVKQGLATGEMVVEGALCNPGGLRDPRHRGLGIAPLADDLRSGIEQPAPHRLAAFGPAWLAQGGVLVHPPAPVIPARSSRFSTLPEALRGRASAKITRSGTLKSARWPRQCSRTACSLSDPPE